MSRSGATALLLGLLLSGCSYLPDWFGEKEEAPLPGKRISLQDQRSQLAVDEETAKMPFVAPPAVASMDWPQWLGTASGRVGNLSAPGTFPEIDSFSAGSGEEFVSPMVPPPVSDGNRIYAIDGAGIISAHDLSDTSSLWTSELLEKENGIRGGGLALAGGTLYVLVDDGRLLALNTADGSKRWLKSLGMPFRSPPRIESDTLLVLSADNQLLALNGKTGDIQWTHRGLQETATVLHPAVPAVRDGLIIVPYSSGEFYAVDLQTGQTLWNDNLSIVRPGDTTTVTRSFTPVMLPQLTAVASGDMVALLQTRTGSRLWDKEISLAAAPWVAGDYLYGLTTDRKLVALHGRSGEVRWIADLAHPEGEPRRVFGPVMAEGLVWVSTNTGQLLALSADKGEPARLIEIPEDVATAPLIVGDKLVLQGSDATVTVLGQ